MSYFLWLQLRLKTYFPWLRLGCQVLVQVATWQSRAVACPSIYLSLVVIWTVLHSGIFRCINTLYNQWTPLPQCLYLFGYPVPAVWAARVWLLWAHREAADEAIGACAGSQSPSDVTDRSRYADSLPSREMYRPRESVHFTCSVLNKAWRLLSLPQSTSSGQTRRCSMVCRCPTFTVGGLLSVPYIYFRRNCPINMYMY